MALTMKRSGLRSAPNHPDAFSISFESERIPQATLCGEPGHLRAVIAAKRSEDASPHQPRSALRAS